MQVKEEGNYKMPDWKLEVRCTGESDWEPKQKPCYDLLILEDGDIVKREGYTNEFYYGCICPKCKCFTEIYEKLIPKNVKRFAPKVASKNSDAWFELSDEEKKLSEGL